MKKFPKQVLIVRESATPDDDFLMVTDLDSISETGVEVATYQLVETGRTVVHRQIDTTKRKRSRQ